MFAEQPWLGPLTVCDLRFDENIDAFQSGSSVDAAPTARSHPTSESGGSIEIATQKVDDAELFPIRDSDIQLVEQTEPDDSAAAAMGRLNIRAFKILGILRERAKSMGNVDASSTEQVATVSFSDSTCAVTLQLIY